jgi:hypothetical protein
VILVMRGGAMRHISMSTKLYRSTFSARPARNLVALLLVALLLSDFAVFAQQEPASGPAEEVQDAPKIPSDQLDSLVAPIALYPDPLLSQTLVASTYPLEIMQLQQWLDKNKNLKGKAQTDAVSKQTWDPSVQAMAALPDVVKRLADDIQWTTDLGNAFLAQQSEVMDAVQRMRQKAQGAGALKSNEQQKVQTEVVENKTVIVVQQADPQVVYVPSYNPTVVYGAPVYPYPPIYYPPSTGAVIAASAISFGVGVAIGAAWGGGGWGWNTGWGHNDINVNVNNNFNRSANINNISGNRGGNRTWQHNPQHRGGAPYSNRATAQRYGGTARADSLANRQAGARQQLGRQGGNLPSTRDANRGGVGDQASNIGDRKGVSDRTSSVGDRKGVSDRASSIGDRGDISDRAGTSGNRDALSDRAGVSDRAGRTGDRGGDADRAASGNRGSLSDRAPGDGNRTGGGGDRIGGSDVPRSSGSRDRDSFGGGSGGFNGGAARASSSRGASSMGGGGGGGMRGGGGGGMRGGGGRRR